MAESVYGGHMTPGRRQFLSNNKKPKDINLKHIEVIDSSKFEIGCLIMRLQVHQLHDAHRALIDLVVSNHSKVILFLGVANIQNTRRNPLDFATRRAMVSELYPSVVILPLKDMREDADWSKQLDDAINTPFGSDKKALLYGGRDSFIPHYKGKHTTTELTTDRFLSGTEIRNKVSKEILSTSDFRAGVIHNSYAQRPCVYPTVDIALINKTDGKLLLARKPFEAKWRFPGGFFDLKLDNTFEQAALRELREECGDDIETTEMEYVCSTIVDDWRYRKEDSKIVTTLYTADYITGRIEPNDDVFELMWVSMHSLDPTTTMMPEHIEMADSLLNHLNVIRF